MVPTDKDHWVIGIPAEGIARLHQIINAGVRIRGVIIADDELNRETPPAPANPIVSLPSLNMIALFFSRVLRSLLIIAAVGVVLWLFALSLIDLAPFILFGIIFGAGASVAYDPKLVILVDDEDGGTVWVSLFTWYE